MRCRIPTGALSSRPRQPALGEDTAGQRQLRTPPSRNSRKHKEQKQQHSSAAWSGGSHVPLVQTPPRPSPLLSSWHRLFLHTQRRQPTPTPRILGLKYKQGMLLPTPGLTLACMPHVCCCCPVPVSPAGRLWSAAQRQATAAPRWCSSSRRCRSRMSG